MSECFGRCNETVSRDEELSRKDAEIARLKETVESQKDLTARSIACFDAEIARLRAALERCRQILLEATLWHGHEAEAVRVCAEALEQTK